MVPGTATARLQSDVVASDLQPPVVVAVARRGLAVTPAASGRRRARVSRPWPGPVPVHVYVARGGQSSRNGSLRESRVCLGVVAFLSLAPAASSPGRSNAGRRVVGPAAQACAGSPIKAPPAGHRPASPSCAGHPCLALKKFTVARGGQISSSSSLAKQPQCSSLLGGVRTEK